MDWNKGFSAIFYGSFIDALTFRDIKRFDIIGGSISRKDSDLMESAEVDCVDFENKEQWVRLWMDTKQSGESSHNALFTGLACSPTEDIDGYRSTHTVQIYSVLKPCEDVLLPRGWYVSGGSNGGAWIKELLSVTPAPVIVAGTTPSLSQTIIAEEGETRLSMAQKILNSIGWRIRIDGMGKIYVLPKATEMSARFDTLTNDSIEPSIQKEYDWFECPNVFRAVSGDISATVRDDDPKSPLSTISRGREIWMEETNCDTAEGESITDYALRRLKKEQQVGMKVSYDRRYNPDVCVSDIVYLNYPSQDIVGNFIVTSQSIELGAGVKTSEEVMKV